ncbi:type II toxin-antitoxin system VapC family toxin [Caulobacter segnis]|uniref:type II toxin-antitoxin system VapC family toxin n=1 Tax=Caulobacter segnis TaxID=88688 RepID=UPI0024105C6C|nr:type II toxin-antitoxin system VapC family toxin [Caulobacter segnis]MDG2520409.1 type II toxin-antitoxin system VapC family toxin [Caulobacter segnis]
MFLLDTNIVSELRKSRRGGADPRVVAWAEQSEADAFFISAITVLELELGVLRMERRDPRQGAALRDWLDHQVTPEFRDRVLPVDGAVARTCAGLHVPDSRAERDALIAATALTHGMIVATRNTSDFVSTGVKLVDPWQADGSR